MATIRVGVGGFASDVGKTTLVCELLRALPGWEAVKTTRGHYRSCGKDPHACCVSGMLSDEPLVLTGREQTYAPGKDTGRYWEAGASNVHWVVATDVQVGRGVTEALARVRSRGVVVEGNSPLRQQDFDFFIMVARLEAPRIKPTARRVLGHVSALYLSDAGGRDVERARAELAASVPGLTGLPIYTRESLRELIGAVRSLGVRGGTTGVGAAVELL
jgi:hypothetical protein